MELTLYRRHAATCRFADKGAGFTKCTCPIWCYGRLAGKPLRRSVGLRDWARAVRRVESWEQKPETILTAGPEIGKAIAAFLADGEARGLAPTTIVSYRTFLKHLEDFCVTRRTLELAAIDAAMLTDFRGQRGVARSTQAKEIETLKTFWRFCVTRKWAPENPAAVLKPPAKAGSPPTMPFTAEEIAAIVAACDRIDNAYTAGIARARARAQALVLLLLYSGLRISDAVKLERASLDPATGRLMLRMMKTKVALYVTLQREAVEALQALPVESPYFFWSGTSKLSTAVGSARRTIDCLMRLAGIEGHPHRFRDTFSVRLLEQGSDIRTVQLLLGHTSIKTTEKHYAPFVGAMQKTLDAATAKLQF